MDRRRHRRATLTLAALAALAVYAIAHLVFPYHSTNHDEAVYLQQAGMLLEGQLFLRPPVVEAFRPWFFVRDGTALYPKYAPVPAAVFALGLAVGDPRLSLALVGGGVVALTVALATQAFDRPTGLLAGVLLLASPLFLVDASVFLPYVPTLLFELVFAVAYLRAHRIASQRWAAVAGAAAGIAFFARPYTAVLFVLPFVSHALWTLRAGGRVLLVRLATTAVFGLCGVAVALGYNALVTGDPLLFPYKAFAPRDGLGFGERAILGYEVTYTPTLALRANAEVLARLFGRWVVAGPLGTLLAIAGLARLAVQLRNGHDTDVGPRLVLAGLFVSVAAGNVLFWGNLNILGVLSDPSDGLVRTLGPYYHLDLLVPTAVFAASGMVAIGRQVGRATRVVDSPKRARPVALAVMVVGAAIFGGAAGVAVAEPLGENRAASDQLAAAYAPFEDRALEDSLVFLPTPYGDWLNHPFQALRNDPGYDGTTVYALREQQFSVIDAFPDRTYYRYGYRGRWTPLRGQAVEPRLQRVRVASGDRVLVESELGVPAGADSVSIRLATDEGAIYYAANASRDRLNLTLVLANGTARLTGDADPTGAAAVPFGARDTVEMTAHVAFTAGGFDYRLATPVERTNGTIRALTPYAEVCYDARRCGGEAIYVPGVHTEGVSVRTRLASRAHDRQEEHNLRDLHTKAASDAPKAVRVRRERG